MINIKRYIAVLLAALFLAISVSPAVYAEYQKFTYDEWKQLSADEQYIYYSYIVEDNGGSCKLTVDDMGKWTYAVWQSYCELNGDGIDLGTFYGISLDTSNSAKANAEMLNFADFGLGIYSGDDSGSSSGHFDTMDEALERYRQEHPYEGILQFDANGQALLDNGCYIKLVVNSQYTHTSTKDKHQTFFSVVLYDASGAKIKKLDMYDKITLEGGNANEYSCYSTLGTCDGVLGFELMDGTTGTYAIRFLVYDSSVGDFVTKVKYFGLTSALLGDDADNATPINPDDTAINSDNVSEDYMQDFYEWLIRLLLDDYGKPIDFDDSGIIEALNSIYAKLHAILTSMENGFDKVIGKLDSIVSRLENVISAIKGIDTNSADMDNESFITKFTELMTKFKDKLGFTNLKKSIDNISLAFFGTRQFEETEDEEEIEVTLYNSSGTAVSTTTLPHHYFTVLGAQCDLYGLFYIFQNNNILSTFKQILGLFLSVKFFIGLFRSIPNVLMSSGDVKSAKGE